MFVKENEDRKNMSKLTEVSVYPKTIGRLDWIELDWNALFHVDKIVEKNQINECIIQVLAHINRYV